MTKFNPQPKQGLPPKKEPKPLKRTRIKHKKKDHSLINLMEQIAESREWACWVSGERLWQLTATQFMHVLPKGLNKYPHFRAYDKNIILATDEVHFAWDHKSREELKKIPMFDKLFRLEAELKEEYHKLYGKK